MAFCTRPEFTEPKKRSLLYMAFVHDLRFGTYHEGRDESGLNRVPVSQANLKRLTSRLLEFSDWLVKRHGATMLNPIHHQSSYADQIIFWRKWGKQKAGSLLTHIKSHHRAADESIADRRHALPGSNNCFLPETKAFPTEHIEALLWTGFSNPVHHDDPRLWVKFNLRDMLITLLCLYGGCRKSEPLHLWIDDVYVDPHDPESALVLIHEPHEGLIEFTDSITGVRKNISRADFLQRFCNGKKPLTQETGRRHAGWKGCLLTHRKRKAFQVFWIDKNAGRLFLKLWRMYVQHVRPVALQTPWAFLTKAGQPLGVDGFSDSFCAAIRRIGLVQSKLDGTSCHGLRHRYGQWLNELGMGDKEGQVAMHHINAKSQEIYRQIGINKVAESIAQMSITVLPPYLEIM